MEKIGFLSHEQLPRLLEALEDEGYDCYGPRLQDGVIGYQPLQDVEQLPRGWGVEQAPASYRTIHHQHFRYFAWSNGPQALKPLVFSPRELLWESQRDATGVISFSTPLLDPPPIAVIGVRACDLAALQLQDEHFLRGGEPDPAYQARRKVLFLVSVNCSHPSATCFCASTGDGPWATAGFDLGLDELDDGFVVQAGTPQGQHILDGLDLPEASEAQLETVDRQHRTAAQIQQRRLPQRDLHKTILERLEHPHWQQVAARCLACGNCTAVCPTCFCHREYDEGGLNIETSKHVREWDSCFNETHSYLHGIVVRAGNRQRYRQWLCHKLGTWHEQYHRSGCVGCGRCITWCPVGIDLTAEVAVLCEEEVR